MLGIANKLNLNDSRFCIPTDENLLFDLPAYIQKKGILINESPVYKTSEDERLMLRYPESIGSFFRKDIIFNEVELLKINSKNDYWLSDGSGLNISWSPHQQECFLAIFNFGGIPYLNYIFSPDIDERYLVFNSYRVFSGEGIFGRISNDEENNTHIQNIINNSENPIIDTTNLEKIEVDYLKIIE